MRDPCNCQAELGGIARIVEVSFLSFKFVWYGEVWGEGGGGHYGIHVNVMLNWEIFCCCV